MRWLIATFTFRSRRLQRGPPICRSPHRESTHRRRRIAPSRTGAVFMLAEISVSLARDRSNFSTGGVTFATADTALFGAVGGGQAGSIGKPVHWSWAWKAIMTGVIPKVA